MKAVGLILSAAAFLFVVRTAQAETFSCSDGQDTFGWSIDTTTNKVSGTTSTPRSVRVSGADISLVFPDGETWHLVRATGILTASNSEGVFHFRCSK